MPTEIGASAGMIKGTFAAQLSATNLQLWLGAGVGLATGLSATSFYAMPFFYQRYSRVVYEN